MLVMSSIMLALAFFVSIQVNLLVLDGMRTWISGFATTPEGSALIEERNAAVVERDAAAASLAERIEALRGLDAPLGDVAGRFGGDFDALREDAGRLPVGREGLALAAGDAQASGLLTTWLDQSRIVRDAREVLARPAQLRLTLEESGVATDPEKIAGDRVRTFWLMGLALLVAFVGILNAMLMSVTERFREIGTMKCLGAMDGFIIKLFMLESLIQGLIGTAVGVLAGTGLSLLIAWGTYGEFAFIALPIDRVVLVAGIALLIGIGLTVGGAMLPAWQAARMQPVVAMRTDV
jgi:predicted outer membrane lipoprotein